MSPFFYLRKIFLNKIHKQFNPPKDKNKNQKKNQKKKPKKKTKKKTKKKNLKSKNRNIQIIMKRKSMRKRRMRANIVKSSCWNYRKSRKFIFCCSCCWGRGVCVLFVDWDCGHKCAWEGWEEKGV